MNFQNDGLISKLRELDKQPNAPRHFEGLKTQPERVLWVLIDGVTPEAMRQAHTPTFDALAARGVSAVAAQSVFPTITGPAHTSMLTGSRVGTHGFLYPKMLDAFGNRLFDFSEGMMRAETVAEAWRPSGITSAGFGSRFLRGADMMMTEGVVGEDFVDITEQAISTLREWGPHLLHAVYYVADTAGHLYGPEAPKTLLAIEWVDAMTARLLDAYNTLNLDEKLVVVVNADHGMVPVREVIPNSFAEGDGAYPHGRVALSPRELGEATLKSLMGDPRVEDIYTRDELTLLGAFGSGWGEWVLLLREGFMFESSKPLLGYHGAWSETERHIPLILSGAGVREGASLDICELIDIAPTLSILMGGAIPEQNQGRVLWEVLDAKVCPQVRKYRNALEMREKILDEFKALKCKLAKGMLSWEDYVDQRKMLIAEGKLQLDLLEKEGAILNHAFAK